MQVELALRDGPADGDVTIPYVRERPGIGSHEQVDLVSGVDDTELDALIVADQPPVAPVARLIAQLEAHHRPCGGQRFQVDPALHVEHDHVRIDVHILQDVRHPPLAPFAQRPDGGQQIMPGARQPVGRAVRRYLADQDIRLFQRFEPAREQGRRHAWHAAMNLVEPA